MFSCNEHPIERVLRVIIGVGLITMVYTGPQTNWGWLGIIPLVTGITGFCPLYRIFGLNFCRMRPQA
jgi:Protein of unknown function (DUF2892)